MPEDSLKDWVRKELVSNTDVAERILAEHKEKIRNLISIRDDGTVVIHKANLTSRKQIILYLLGAAYAKVAELRKEEYVSNKEILENLRMKKGTVDPTLKELREEGLAIQIKSGLHHINYTKINNIFEEIKL